MEKRELVEYWLDMAEKDYQTMKHLYASGDYHWSLFLGHLVIEKLLKALFVAHQAEGANIPRSHDLLLLDTGN
ncbi:MAG: HEPN domain-containing protein [Firmicutes bacterium]|nr:HEPN domain-containing protein [Bacillota bacterium]